MADKVTLEVDSTAMADRFHSHTSKIVAQLTEMRLEQKSLVSAITEALTQLHLSRTYEKRIDRLETAVFGKPG